MFVGIADELLFLQDKRVLRLVENVSSLCGITALGSEAVSGVVTPEKWVLDSGERVGRSGSVINPPKMFPCSMQ